MAFFSGNKNTTDKNETAKNVFHFGLCQKNILVTGANGQLGSEIKRHAGLISDRFTFFFTDVDSLDITDKSAIELFVKEKNINYIINCAAYVAVDKAEDDIELCYKINRDAVENIAVVANKNNVRVIHPSTDYVFDGKATTPYLESDAVSPQSVYGKSKLEGEQVLMQNNPQSMVIRTAWLYSIYGNNFVKTMIRLGRERNELNVVADQTGTPTNAADLAESILKIIDYSETNEFLSGVYHFSDMGITTWYDFTIAIHKYAGITTCKVSPITTDQYPTRAVRPKYSVLSKDKIINTFGIQIPEWEESLSVCVKELLSQE